MIVSRRSMLLTRPSALVMRAAGRAASPAGAQAILARQAAARFAKLTGERAGRAITR